MSPYSSGFDNFFVPFSFPILQDNKRINILQKKYVQNFRLQKIDEERISIKHCNLCEVTVWFF